MLHRVAAVASSFLHDSLVTAVKALLVLRVCGRFVQTDRSLGALLPPTVRITMLYIFLTEETEAKERSG